MTAAEFSQRPFAVGSLMGVRSFRVLPGGVLTGVVQREPWMPGVNEAVCSKPYNTIASAMLQAGASAAELAWAMTDMACRFTGVVNLRKRPRRPTPPTSASERPSHQAGTLDCTCGFYAYFDEGHNPHHGLGNILGIVEGFGVCTTGTRGFRSSKARIRALVLEDWFTLGSAVRANYPDVPVFPTLAAALAEFPLTPVEGARKPEPASLGGVVVSGGTVTYTMTVDTRAFDEALQRMLRAYQPKRTAKPATGETPQQRALRMRRERNTGPVDPRGIDGHYRRGQQ